MFRFKLGVGLEKDDHVRIKKSKSFLNVNDIKKACKIVKFEMKKQRLK